MSEFLWRRSAFLHQHCRLNATIRCSVTFKHCFLKVSSGFCANEKVAVWKIMKVVDFAWDWDNEREWKNRRERARDGNGGRKERGSEMERVLSKRYMHTNSDGKEGQQMLSIECHKFIVFIICSEAAVNCLQFFFFVFLFCSLFPQFFFLSILSFCVSLFSASLGESQ